MKRFSFVNFSIMLICLLLIFGAFNPHTAVAFAVSDDEATLKERVVNVDGTEDIDSDMSVDATSPYTGKYLLAMNTASAGSTAQTTGKLSSSEIDAAISAYSVDSIASSEEGLEGVASVITLEDGTKLYQNEPHSFLEGFNAPTVKITAREEENDSKFSVFASNESVMSMEDGKGVSLSLNGIGTFYAIDDYKNSLYSFFAKYVYSGTYCDVVVECDSDGSNQEIANTYCIQMGQEFDNNQRSFMVENFGSYLSGTGNGGTEFGKDGKITIILQNLRDDYYYGYGNGYTAGYFWDADFSTGSGYNNMACIHIDTCPAMYTGSATPSINGAKSTMIHEFQHLIHFTNETIEETYSPLWLNEAFSMSAQYMRYGDTSRITQYNSQGNSSLLATGAILNYTDYEQNSDDMYSNYCLPMLFGQYLRTQTKNLTGGGNAVFKSILASTQSGDDSMVDGLNSINYSVTDLTTLFANFRMALVLKESTGYYGFTGESDFSALKTLLFTGTTASLKGGAAVVKQLNNVSFAPSGAGSNIIFKGFSPNSTSSEVTGVTISGPSAINTQYGEIQLTATVSPSSASQSVVWSTLSPLVYVDASTGQVVALSTGNGTAVVRATSAVNSAKYAEKAITITNNAELPEDIEIYNGNMSLVSGNPPITQYIDYDGGTAALTAAVLPSNAAQNVTWSSSNTAIATVDSYGTVKAVKSGNVNITATCVADSSISATIPFIISGQIVVPTSVSITGGNTITQNLGTQQLSATVLPDGAGQEVTWSSSAPGVASVDENGLVTAFSNGTTTITAKTVYNPLVKGTLTITVSGQLDVPTAIIISDGDSISTDLGTLQLTATPSPDTGDPSVTWTSSDTSIATVDDNGLVILRNHRSFHLLHA